MILQPNNMLHPLIDQLSLRQLASLRPQVCIVVLQHELVDIDLADASGYAALGDFVWEPVGAVEDYADTAGDLLVDGFESVQSIFVRETNRPLRAVQD